MTDTPPSVWRSRLRGLGFQIGVFWILSLVLRVVLHGKFGQQLNLDWRETFKFYAVGALRDGLVGLFVLMPVAVVVFGVGEKKSERPSERESVVFSSLRGGH